MKFVSLTLTVLLDLKSKGYNILTSRNNVGDENPSYYPIKVPDVREYLLRLDCRAMIAAFQEPAILVIEDVLNISDDGTIEGQVFIEDDYQQRLEQRLQLYNQYYQFIANPEVYDFSFDPQGVLIRNHAVHTGDHAMYLEYLQLHYPDHVSSGMQDLEDLTRSLICLDTAQACDWFLTHRVAVIESDIWFCDEDAILKVLDVQQADYVWHISDDTEELIYSQITPQDILPLRDLFWIDPRIRKKM
ncbi:hypothetical protein [Sphingobacterium faecium]|uniref:hypothetical protein n=1 Tax=Sphingobacterium faecium TaxID=34087 RepID=UPI002468B873|nr:hypothetical protein [Sphingobacterium faecium]MDH5826721.1 hypothetical protein [Sphingobacterium faecium]